MKAFAFNRVVLVFLAAALTMAGVADAASKSKIDRRVEEALTEFREDVGGADAVLAKSVGVLVFPSVKKAGIGIGGEYGEGALRVGDQSVAYYSTAAASIGLQLGAQARRQVVVFLEQEALDKFRESDGWDIGSDASVAVISVGAGTGADTLQANKPIVAYVFDNKGLMANISLEGSKISRIHEDD